MGHLLQLLPGGPVEPRMMVAMHVAPHACGAIEIAVAIDVKQGCPLPSLDQQRLILRHLCEGMPDMGPVPVSEGGGIGLANSGDGLRRHQRRGHWEQQTLEKQNDSGRQRREIRTGVPISPPRRRAAEPSTTAISSTPCEPTSVTAVPGGASP